MENLSINTVRSFLGRNVNLHLKDGAVIVNVQVTKFRKGLGKNNDLIEYSSSGNQKALSVPLKVVAWAEMLNSNFIQI